MVLPPNVTAPSIARQAIRDVCCPAHPAGEPDEAELLVTEVVTNAVLHGAPPLILRITCHAEDGLVVRVSDNGAAPPVLQHLDALEASGRGLALVEAISDDWGTEYTPTGKSVWFRLIAPDATAPVPGQRRRT